MITSVISTIFVYLGNCYKALIIHTGRYTSRLTQSNFYTSRLASDPSRLSLVPTVSKFLWIEDFTL